MSFGDLRHACRSILRMPVLSSVIVFSLAAGIGINTVVFSWVQARLLRPVPGVSGGARIQLIEPRSEAGLYTGASWREYLDMRERLRSFEHVFAARMAPLYVGEPGAVERVFGLLVSDNYFAALPLEPALGRFFRPDEVQHPGGEPVAVISHGLWQTRFLGAADVLGRTVRINGRDLAIIGVTPPAFQGTTLGLQFDAWLPATLAPLVANGSREIAERSIRGYSVMGRLAAGTSRAQAEAELDALMRQLASAYPATNERVTAEVLPFSMSPRGPQRMLNYALAMLQGVMLLLLLAVCGNVANLMLARASARRKEIGIRLALGARPRRIAATMLTETVLLGIAGALLGAAMAVWGTRALLIIPMTGLPMRFQTSIDLLGLGFAVGLGILCGVLFGAAPAVQLSRVDPHVAFRSGARTVGRSRLRHALMAIQVGLAVVVLIVGGMFLRSFMSTRDTDPGFRCEGLLLAAYDLSGRGVDAAFNRMLASRTLERLRAVPSVESVAIASSVPLDIHGLPSRVFTVDGHSRADGGFDEALTNIVTPWYFATMGIDVVAGRDFSDLNDPGAARQAIVNEEFVRRYVPTGEPLGRQIRARGGPYVIIGVVRNSLYNAYGEPPTPAVYFSYRDNPQPRGEIHLRVRGNNEAQAAADVRRVMRELDAELPVFNVRSMTQHVESNLLFRRIPAQMFSVLAPLLLVLAAIGIYAVVAYAASLRKQEVGVRLALGATAQQVVRQLVSESLTVALSGAVIGWAFAFLLATQFADREIGPLVFGGVPIILILVATIASWIPARQAARVDPAETLRAET